MYNISPREVRQWDTDEVMEALAYIAIVRAKKEKETATRAPAKRGGRR